MATFRIPTENGVRQLNLNDTSGEIWSSFNIDLHTEVGKIKLARPLRLIEPSTSFDGAGGAEDTTIQAIVYGDTGAGQKIHILTNESLYGSTTDFDTYGAITASTANALDAVMFDGKIIVTTSGDLDSWNGGTATYTENWWTGAGGTALLTVTAGVASSPFILENVRIGEETLVVTAGSVVRAYTGATSGGGTFTAVDLDDALFASCVKAGIDKVFIGTGTTTGEDAYVIKWDGASTNYDVAYPVGSKMVLAMELVDNVPLIVTERGDIKLFNGVGFTRIAQFPFVDKPISVTEYLGVKQTQTMIHPKGIKVVGRNVFFIINPSDGTTPVDERSPAGLWVLNLDTRSLNHLASPYNESDTVNNSPILILPNEAGGRFFFAGNVAYDNTLDGLYREDLGATTHYGYFVTTEIESESVQDTYKEVIIKALLGASDNIVVKYRTSNDTEYPKLAEAVTWVNTTTFNTTATLSHVLERFQAGKLDEVEVIKGSGAGRLAHITNIEFTGSVYSITVDEAIGEAGESADIRIDNWIKVPVEMTEDDGEIRRFGFGEDNVGTWIQLKIALQGKSGIPEIRQVLLKTNAKETL
jgi:hypothetical protein